MGLTKSKEYLLQDGIRMHTGRSTFMGWLMLIGMIMLVSSPIVQGQSVRDTWVQELVLTNRRDHTMVNHGGQVLLFGGSDRNAALADTWVWDGRRWNLRRPSSAPPARSNHAMAYDSHRRRTVLFGGLGDNGVLGDT